MNGPLDANDTSHAPAYGTNSTFVIASPVDAVSDSALSTPAIANVAAPAADTVV